MLESLTQAKMMVSPQTDSTSKGPRLARCSASPIGLRKWCMYTPFTPKLLTARGSAAQEYLIVVQLAVLQLNVSQNFQDSHSKPGDRIGQPTWSFAHV